MVCIYCIYSVTFGDLRIHSLENFNMCTKNVLIVMNKHIGHKEIRSILLHSCDEMRIVKSEAGRELRLEDCKLLTRRHGNISHL